MVMSRTSSKCTARDTQQVNRHIHTFLLAFASLPRRYRGPVKLTAVYVNGGASFTRNSGRRGCGGALIGLPSYRLQTTQPWTTARMKPLPPIIQNFEQTSARVSLTPLWHTLWWASWIIRTARWCFLFRSMGCFADYGRSAFCSLPPHLHSPRESWNRLNCVFHTGNLLSCWIAI